MCYVIYVSQCKIPTGIVQNGERQCGWYSRMPSALLSDEFIQELTCDTVATTTTSSPGSIPVTSDPAISEPAGPAVNTVTPASRETGL